MIELFSRRPGTIDLPEDAVLTPIPVEDDVISLSAILLEDSYYKALQSARQSIQGIAIIDETLLIPFKARGISRPDCPRSSWRKCRQQEHQKAPQRRVPVGTTVADRCTHRAARADSP